jgi:8-oxo-dGTP pyrophosphatase MutT (NUDIX family)
LKECSVNQLKIHEALSGYRRAVLPPTPVKAAVLLPVVTGGAEPEILFTKRPVKLNAHGGEVSFPGGAYEEGDESLLHTALRETFEEVGICGSKISIAGALDDEISKAGFRVTPYVGLIEKPFELSLSEDEVERVYSIPFSTLKDPSVSWQENWIRFGAFRRVHFYKYSDDIIWGLTGRFLYNFFQVLKIIDF